MSSLQFHFLQTLEHRTDVSVTSTSLWWEAPEERGAPWVPASPPQRAGACWGPPQGPRAVPCGSLSRCQPCTGLARAGGVPCGRGCLAPLGPWSLPGAALLPLLLSQPVLVPLGLEIFGSVAQKPPLSCTPARVALCSLAWSKRGDGLMCWPFSNPVCPNLSLLFPKTRKCVQPSSAAFIVETNLKRLIADHVSLGRKILLIGPAVHGPSSVDST